MCIRDSFYRVDKSRSKQIGGTGLGLSIVKHGAMFHHARVSLESEPNKGTTVRVTLDVYKRQDILVQIANVLHVRQLYFCSHTLFPFVM